MFSGVDIVWTELIVMLCPSRFCAHSWLDLRNITTFAASQDHFRAKIRIVLSKLCRKFGFEEIKALMPEEDKKLVAHMQTTAERELKAKKTHLSGGHEGGDDWAKRGGDGGIKKALRTFDTMMEGKCGCFAFVFVAGIGSP